MKNVQQEIARAIAAKLIIQTTKTKGRLEGGRQLVSIGPYVTAVPEIGKKYVIIFKNGVAFSSTAVSAAKTFIEFVGRQQAWDALVHTYSKKGRHEDAKRLAAVR